MNLLSEVTGEGRPLVLVPGGLTGWLSWIPIAQRLSASRKAVRVQLLAVQWGLDRKPLPDDYSPKTESAALASTLTSLGLTPPVDFAAWSAGGAVTLDFALDNPRWVRTLTLVEPGAFWVLPTLDVEAKRARDHDMTLSRDDVSDEALERWLRGSAMLPPGTDPRATPMWDTMVRHRQSLRGLPSAWTYERDLTALPKLAAPTLLVKGTGSQPILHRVVDELAKQLPNAEVAEWPGGHAPHLASMEPFLARMDAFQGREN